MATGRMPDLDRFRLRRFVETLIERDEVKVHEREVDLADVSAIIEATPKAVLFRKAGPERLELVAGVMGSRARLAAALDTAEKEAAAE